MITTKPCVNRSCSLWKEFTNLHSLCKIIAEVMMNTNLKQSWSWRESYVPGCTMTRNIKFRHDMDASCPSISDNNHFRYHISEDNQTKTGMWKWIILDTSCLSVSANAHEQPSKELHTLLRHDIIQEKLVIVWS